MQKWIDISLVIILLTSCGRKPVDRLQAEQPAIALINEVWYRGGEQYVHPSFDYAGTGFLVVHKRDTFAVTAKHILWVAKTKDMKRVDINGRLEKWLMHPKNNLTDTVRIDRLLNADSTESIEMHDATITQRDWLVFSTRYISPNLRPLYVRKKPIRLGEKIRWYSCPYPAPNCITGEGEVIELEGNKFVFSRPDDFPVAGASGSPVVDNQGMLLGILGGTSIDKTDGKPALYGIGTRYLKSILRGQQPNNEPLVPISEVLAPIIAESGAKAAVRQFKILRQQQKNLLVYDFSVEQLNRLGKKLLQTGQAEAAIEVLQLSISEIPWFFTTFNLLGSAYEQLKQKDAAREAYQKSLSLQPQNQEAVNALARLKE